MNDGSETHCLLNENNTGDLTLKGVHATYNCHDHIVKVDGTDKLRVNSTATTLAGNVVLPTTTYINSTSTELIPSGGTTGQVLTKDSNSNYDYSWQGVPVNQTIAEYYYRVNTVAKYDAQVIGTTGDRKTSTPSATGARLVNMAGLDFSRDGTTQRGMNAGEISALSVSITPQYSTSLIVIEMHIQGEPNTFQAGFWMGVVNAANEIELCTRSGYEGYNPSIATGRNNFYHSSHWDDNNGNSMKSMSIVFFDKPQTTSQVTYCPIWGSAYYNNREFNLNSTVQWASDSTNPAHETAVTVIKVKEIRQ